MSRSQYVDGTYAEAHPDWHDEGASWKADQIVDFLRQEDFWPRSVCDLGCGAGGVLAGLGRALHGVRLVGYDVSPQAVRIAGTKHPNVDVRLGEVDDVDELFDLIMLIDVFEHVEDYLGFLRRVAPLCRRLLCHVPLDMTALMIARERPIVRLRDEFGHLHYFSKTTALASLRDAGYEVNAYRYTPGSLELPNRSTRIKVAAWPRRLGFRVAPDLTVRTLGGYSLLVLATPRLPADP